MAGREVTIDEARSPGFYRQSEDTFLLGVVLVLKKSEKDELQVWRQPNSRGKRPANTNMYDRLVIMGALRSKDCFAIISYSKADTTQLFKSATLTIGSVVQINEPMYQDQCLGHDRANPIMSTRETVTTIAIPINIMETPIPVTIDSDSSATMHFRLAPRRLLFLSALVTAGTCGGTTCDRRRIMNNCFCMQKTATAGWAMSSIIVTERVDDDNDELVAGVPEPLQSHQLTKLFCTRAKMEQPSNTVVQADLRAAVRAVQNHVNANGGWQVVGYTKCGTTSEGLTRSVEKVRIASLRPTCQIPDNLKYDIARLAAPEVEVIANVEENAGANPEVAVVDEPAPGIAEEGRD